MRAVRHPLPRGQRKCMIARIYFNKTQYTENTKHPGSGEARVFSGPRLHGERRGDAFNRSLGVYQLNWPWFPAKRTVI